MSEHNRDRSVSGGADDSDFESQIGDTNQPGKPGRKKKANSQAARRDQNRIAQREFRLRKQQRIRDLEARVEILSGTRDEALGEMRHVLKDLMAENHTLRGLLRNLASFIGDGGGGFLPKIGWNLQDFNNYINKGETDTAWEGYQRRKKTNQTEPEASTSSNFVANSTTQKRSAEVDMNGSSTKKRRSDDKEFDANSSGGFPMVVPLASSPQTTSLYAPTRPQDQNIFSDLMRGTDASSLFIPPANPTAQYSNSGLDYSRSYVPQVPVGMEQATPSSFYESPRSTSNPVAQSRLQQSSDNVGVDEIEEDDDPKKNEAHKLINYHLENYKRNSSYCLPASLRPTIVQRTMPHESVIDHVLHPQLRDRMILSRQRYDLVDCLVDMRAATTIHGDDVLAHQNWELGEKFIRKYSFLVDAPLLKTVNRWRLERGDPEIVLPENAGERT